MPLLLMAELPNADQVTLENTTFWDPSWQTAPGSVITTTVCDMAASAVAVGTGTLLTPAQQATMLDPLTTTVEPAPDCPDTICRQMVPAVGTLAAPTTSPHG